MVRGLGSSCPHARPTGKGGGCVCPRSLWGQRKLGRGGWGLRSAQRPEGGEGERGKRSGGFLFHLCSPPVHPAICCQTSLEKAFFC